MAFAAPVTASTEAQSMFDQDKIYAYDYTDLNEDIEAGNFAGFYGWDNCCWIALAEQRHNNEHPEQKLDMLDRSGNRTQDETYQPAIKDLLDNPETQRYWKRICTFHPQGMTSKYPSIAATTALLNIPELADLERDGEIVDETGAVKTIKAAVQYSWNIAALSERIHFTPDQLLDTLYKWTHHEMLAPSVQPRCKVFQPAVGGMTVYIFGDPRKIRDPATKIAVRVHDECCGSDVFGTDICTCRPYLMFAMKYVVQVAQKGGVGVIVYFKKEGRALGEVTKYRVYNARKNQQGGDTAANYFFQTESIAGVRDARFQTMMPDALHWLGITRIDYLLSMSNEKYDAIVEGEIQVEQRIALPSSWVPLHADVEITAKIASGYHTNDLNSEAVIANTRILASIREQSRKLFAIAVENDGLAHWRVDMGKLDSCVDLVMNVTRERFGDDYQSIPLHSRFRHFEADKIASLFERWMDVTDGRDESCRRLIDLMVVSVLLDSGAGNDWKWMDNNNREYNRSEGLAAATLHMFCEGDFSSDSAIRHRVNSYALKGITPQKLAIGFQINHETNQLIALHERVGLLNRLGESLEANQEYFGKEIHRPGHLFDYIVKHEQFDRENRTISVHILWDALAKGLQSIWPSRVSVVQVGDVWQHPLLQQDGEAGSDLVPFHKLMLWMCYSLLECFSYADIRFTDLGDMTALAEYRNGGLLVDCGVVVAKDENLLGKKYEAGSQLMVEFRALTIVLIDEIAKQMRVRFGLDENDTDGLSMSQVMEGGTWVAGRKLAWEKREGDGPIDIVSDGTVW